MANAAKKVARTGWVAVAVALGLGAGRVTGAPDWNYQKFTTQAGVEIPYALSLPGGYDPQSEYTVLLALPPGGQGKYMVELGLKDYWAREGRKRGWIVVSPLAPRGGFAGGTNMGEFCEYLLDAYSVKGGKFHLAGNSNGGMSSFRVALKIPQYFKSITVLAGYTRSLAELDKIKRIPVHLFVGERDTGWLRPMEKMRDALLAMGVDVGWYVAPNEGHEIKSLFNNPMVFDIIEASAD